MSWQVGLTALVLVVVGAAFLFAGYRLFRVLVPIWGFIVGFDLAVALGSNLLHAPTLSSPLGWILAIVVGLIFAALAYAYYYLSVVVLAGSVGFLIGEAVAAAVAPQASTGALVAGIIGAVALAVVTIALDLPKALIVVLTALSGASAAVVGVLLALGKVSLPALQASATGGSLEVIRASGWLSLLTLVLALIGMAAQAGQLRATRYTHAYAHRRSRTTPVQQPAPGAPPRWPAP